MDAETRDRLESWAANLARLSIGDRKFAHEHARNAADIRAALEEIDRLTRAIAEHRSEAKAADVFPWPWDKALWAAIGEPKL